jgi:hypothetical protein
VTRTATAAAMTNSRRQSPLPQLDPRADGRAKLPELLLDQLVVLRLLLGDHGVVGADIASLGKDAVHGIGGDVRSAATATARLAATALEGLWLVPSQLAGRHTLHAHV